MERAHYSRENFGIRKFSNEEAHEFYKKKLEKIALARQRLKEKQEKQRKFSPDVYAIRDSYRYSKIDIGIRRQDFISKYNLFPVYQNDVIVYASTYCKVPEEFLLAQKEDGSYKLTFDKSLIGVIPPIDSRTYDRWLIEKINSNSQVV